MQKKTVPETNKNDVLCFFQDVTNNFSDKIDHRSMIGFEKFSIFLHCNEKIRKDEATGCAPFETTCRSTKTNSGVSLGQKVDVRTTKKQQLHRSFPCLVVNSRHSKDDFDHILTQRPLMGKKIPRTFELRRVEFLRQTGGHTKQPKYTKIHRFIVTPTIWSPARDTWFLFSKIVHPCKKCSRSRRIPLKIADMLHFELNAWESHFLPTQWRRETNFLWYGMG